MNLATKLSKRYIFFVFEETNGIAADTHHPDNIQNCLLNLRPLAQSKETKLTATSDKHRENVENRQSASILHEFLSSFAGTTDLPLGFVRDFERETLEILNIEKIGQKRTFEAEYERMISSALLSKMKQHMD